MKLAGVLLISLFASFPCLAQPAETITSANSTENSNDVSENEEDQLISGEINAELAAEEYQNTGAYWVAPDFSNQTDAQGWSTGAFKVPPGFHRRVAFWIDIYTRYTTQQALLHDGRYVDLIYETVDFNDIDIRTDINIFEKERLKKKRIVDEKKVIREQLKRIQRSASTPNRLSPEDLVVFKKFRFIFGKNKFFEASHRNRLRMQLGQKDRFKLGVFFSGRYIREMEKIFRDEKVPMELTRLPFVESSFNLYAQSRVGASGIWQFMRSTAKLFHLKIDGIKDLRNDPLTATRAAARLLRSNYKMLGSWSLALTGYNHGPAGVANIRKKLKSDDINQIVWASTGRRFGFASENFFAEFLAALEVESHIDRYFGRVEVSPALTFEEVALPKTLYFSEMSQAIRLESDSDDGLERARLYNPYFTRPVTSGYRPIPKGFVVRIPRERKDRFLAQISSLTTKRVATSGNRNLYKVSAGDTLKSISRDFGISLLSLLKRNRMSVHTRLRPGQRLEIPLMEDD